MPAELLRQVLEELTEEEVLGILPDTRVGLEALVNLEHDSMDDYPRNWQAAQAVRLRDPQFQITVHSSRLSSVPQAVLVREENVDGGRRT